MKFFNRTISFFYILLFLYPKTYQHQAQPTILAVEQIQVCDPEEQVHQTHHQNYLSPPTTRNLRLKGRKMQKKSMQKVQLGNRRESRKVKEDHYDDGNDGGKIVRYGVWKQNSSWYRFFFQIWVEFGEFDEPRKFKSYTTVAYVIVLQG